MARIKLNLKSVSVTDKIAKGWQIVTIGIALINLSPMAPKRGKSL